jgi:hypothetical protein
MRNVNAALYEVRDCLPWDLRLTIMLTGRQLDAP